MKGKKSTTCKPTHNHTHGYATRSSFFQISQVSGVVQYIVQDRGLVACKERRKRERKTPPYLPEDLIFRILLLLPAKVLHERMRYVCRKWYNIVNDPAFIRVHLQMSSYIGILVQHHIKQDEALYLELNSARLELEVTELRIPFAAKVVGSCNGLLLLHEYGPECLHVVNLVTKEKVRLPSFVRTGTKFSGFKSNLSYTSSTGRYKVVYVSGDLSEIKMMVCTVGVDTTWRSIDLGNIPIDKFSRCGLLGYPRYIKGYIYWGWMRQFREYGFALDVEGETICQFPAPEGCEMHRVSLSFSISMNTSFGLVTCTDTNLQIWELIDLKSGQWAKVGDLDKEALDGRFRKLLYPRAYKGLEPFYLQNGKLWFRVSVDDVLTLAYYNLWKGNILLCPTFNWGYRHSTCPHVNTLISFESC